MAMTPAQRQQLGTEICDRTPYDDMSVAGNWDRLIEWDAKPMIWQFKELPRRVAMSIRIPVIITYDGEEYLDWILIGYEGGGGGM